MIKQPKHKVTEKMVDAAMTVFACLLGVGFMVIIALFLKWISQ